MTATTARPAGTRGGGTAPVIEMRGIRKVYRSGRIAVEALRGIDLDVHPGEFVAVVGPSGSGKSTLMNLVGCLDTPTAGTYRLDGEEVSGLTLDRLADIRNRKIGFVFQGFHLLPHLAVYENVELPLVYGGVPARRRRERVMELLEQVGLADRAAHRPSEISGGQAQRVAIARALAMDPAIILADEPTGNLDTASGSDVMDLFSELHRRGRTLVVVTHDPALARRAARVVHLRDGRIVDDHGEPAPPPTPQEPPEGGPRTAGRGLP